MLWKYHWFKEKELDDSSDVEEDENGLLRDPKRLGIPKNQLCRIETDIKICA